MDVDEAQETREQHQPGTGHNAIQERAASADDERWAAEQAIRMHSEPPSTERSTGRCAQCLPGGGCPMLAWALAYLDAAHPCRTGPPNPAQAL